MLPCIPKRISLILPNMQREIGISYDTNRKSPGYFDLAASRAFFCFFPLFDVLLILLYF